jgi:hypothetical protein
MARPPLSDWESVFGFSEDPTPGDPEILEQLASEYRSVADDALGAHSVVSRLDSDQLGEGKSMEKLRTKLSELPEQVSKLQSSYETAANAVAKYATNLRESQDQADRALERGREAKQRLDAAIEVASAASAHVQSLDTEGALPPDGQDARSSTRSAMADARQAESEAAQSVEAAEAELEAARLLAVDAQEMRTSDAGVAKRELEEAEGEAVEGKSFWDKIGDILNLVFSVVGAVLGVVAMFVTGPIGIGLAAGALLFGAVSLGFTIGKGADTGEWDVVGIVLGVLGLGVGAVSAFKGFAGVGKLGNSAANSASKVKANLGQFIKDRIKGPQEEWAIEIMDTAPQLGRIPTGGGSISRIDTPPTHVVSGGGAVELSKLDAVLDSLGLIFGLGGFIYSPVEFADKADKAKVYTS